MQQKLKLAFLALSCALLAAVAGVAVEAALLLHAATVAARGLPVAVSAELQTTRSALLAEVTATRKDLTSQIEGARKDVLVRVDRQITAVQDNAMTAIREQGAQLNAQITTAVAIADRRMGDTLARADTALATVDALRKDAKPAFDNSAALVQDLKDSLDDNYDDIKATIGSSTVAVTGVARAAEAVGNAAPSITASVDSVAKSAAKEADQITKPQTFWQGMKSWLLIVSRCAGFFF